MINPQNPFHVLSGPCAAVIIEFFCSNVQDYVILFEVSKTWKRYFKHSILSYVWLELCIFHRPCPHFIPFVNKLRATDFSFCKCNSRTEGVSHLCLAYSKSLKNLGIQFPNLRKIHINRMNSGRLRELSGLTKLEECKFGLLKINSPWDLYFLPLMKLKSLDLIVWACDNKLLNEKIFTRFLMVCPELQLCKFWVYDGEFRSFSADYPLIKSKSIIGPELISINQPGLFYLDYNRYDLEHLASVSFHCLHLIGLKLCERVTKTISLKDVLNQIKMLEHLEEFDTYIYDEITDFDFRCLDKLSVLTVRLTWETTLADNLVFLTRNLSTMAKVKDYILKATHPRFSHDYRHLYTKNTSVIVSEEIQS
jgi:hypothetical protein